LRTSHDPHGPIRSSSEIEVSRRRALGIVGLGGLAAAALALSGCQTQPSTAAAAASSSATPSPSSAPRPKTPAEALARLKDGNARFVAGSAIHPDQDAERRHAVDEHQEPWALVHGCVDSRVSPELVFDQGIGDLFVTRTAGTVLDDTIVGSMEFGTGSPYEVPVLVILGHTGCGAVAATVDAVAANRDNPAAPGEVIDIVKEIAPVVRRTKPLEDKAAYVNEVVRANVISVVDALLERSKIIRDAVDAGRTKVVPAVYDLDTGQVTWL
jgi:carbonic anhydrase